MGESAPSMLEHDEALLLCFAHHVSFRERTTNFSLLSNFAQTGESISNENASRWVFTHQRADVGAEEMQTAPRL